jgi:hypothetical protein
MSSQSASRSANIAILWLVLSQAKIPWRDGRVVEGAALEMLFRGDSNEGSNPSLSVLPANASE